MKKRMYLLLLTASIFSIKAANAQAPYDMMVDGVKVIVQPSGNDLVNVVTVIKGGVQNYTAAKAGIEALAMNSLSECGTLNNDKNTFKNKLDKLNAGVYGSAGKDYSTINMNCLKMDLDKVWPLYVEAITKPKFDEKEFAIVKQNELTSIKNQESSPDFAIDNFAMKTAFEGRSYAINPSGTTASVSALNVADVKAYYNSILTKGRVVIVVVADLSKADIQAKVHSIVGSLKPGAPFNLTKSFFRAYKNTFKTDPRELATNYVEGITSGPQTGAADFEAFMLAMRIFYDRHFLEVRTNNGLSYAPQIAFAPGSTSVSKIMVSTTQPDKYIAVFDKLVDKTKKEGFTAEELKNMKATYLTSFYMRNESNAAQAGSIVANEVLFNDWARVNKLVGKVNAVTLAQVNDAFKKYIGSIMWVYQGDVKKVTPTLFTNGTLNQGGNPVSR